MLLRESISLWVFVSVFVSLGTGALITIGRIVYERVRKKQWLFTPARIFFMGVAALFLLSGLYGTYVEPYWIEVSHHTIATSKLNKTRVRIVFISDLHSDRRIRNEARLPEIVNGLYPDIILFGGDTVNVADAVPLFKKTLSRMQAPLGKYAVWGNRDVWYWKKLDLFSDTGFADLRSTTVSLNKDGEEFFLSGISYRYPDRAKRVLSKVPSEKYHIFLFHSPRLVYTAKEAGVDLYLTGHTHGGQVSLPWYGALITLSKYGKRFESGLYTVGPMAVYVNRGIGMEGGFTPRVRFFSRPEVTVLDIIPQ